MTEPVRAIVTRIENHRIYTDPFKQALRPGYDSSHGLQVGDEVELTYGPTTYGAGWYARKVEPDLWAAEERVAARFYEDDTDESGRMITKRDAKRIDRTVTALIEALKDSLEFTRADGEHGHKEWITETGVCPCGKIERARLLVRRLEEGGVR